MRVIAGRAKRLQLKTLAGDSTRPTTDRIKETLFNMIDHGLGDSRFLDLFAGSGGIGIEALSRGAGRAVFVEKNPAAVRIIKENLRFTHLEENAIVLSGDVLLKLKAMAGEEPFDYIFMDPPYNMEWEKRVLMILQDQPLLSGDGIIIIEASLETDFSYVEELGFTCIKEKKYKTNKHIFLERSHE